MDELAIGWERALERLRTLGVEALAGAADRAQALERLEHLVDQTSLFLNWAVLHADPSRPAFHRHNDLVSQWGGPNADNVYRHARIDPDRRYVIRGRMRSCDEFLLAVRAGFMHRPIWGTLEQRSATELGIGPGDEFEIALGPGPDAIALPEGAVMVSIREYYFDWVDDEPAAMTIECLDPEPPHQPEPLEQRLGSALDEVTDSIEYWRDYMEQHRASRVDNSYESTTVALTKGLAAARYEFCFWRLAPDEALVITTDEPAARYWSAQLYMMDTFEPVDWYGSISSRNHRQSQVSPDGRIRFVVSARDPSVANWLDTSGRGEGLCTLRWFWPTSEVRPVVSTEVVPTADVAGHLGERVQPVPATERAEELARRQAHLRWRFRV
ncbi:MAG: DUF1214 domain-containing protein [Actinomycetota bacterium]